MKENFKKVFTKDHIVVGLAGLACGILSGIVYDTVKSKKEKDSNS